MPLVVYHGESGWTAAKSMRELLGAPKAIAESQLDFRYSLLDLSQLANEEIVGSPVLQCTLRLLKYSRNEQLIGLLGELLRSIASSIPEDYLPEWLQAIGVYVMSVNKSIDSQEYKQTLKSILPVQYEPGSLADRLLNQGREEGRKEGRQEGRQEGLQEGRQEGILAGKIQTLQELLGEPISTDIELERLDIEALTVRLAELQQRLRLRKG